jgi:hypothetical protein
MPTNAELQAHRDWIGALQPVGLVVSAPALFAAGAFPDRNVLEKRNALLSLILPRGAKETDKEFAKRKPTPVRFPALAREVLGWKAGKLFGAADGPPVPESLDLVLAAFNETLRPTYAVAAPKEDEAEWLMLIQELPDGVALDVAPEESGSKRWQASPQVRFERLLREKGVAVGILSNGAKLRLVYAPRGETSGHVTWPLYDLSKASHQEGLSALCMLLGAARLFSLPREQRLPHILKESRKYQNVVSTKLAGQVLEALNELLRGFQAANEITEGELLDATVRDDPNHIYGGLLAVLLRLVFVLYAEERGLLSSSETYVRNYALVGLFDKLRIDAGRFPDTMDQRYGAWSRLLVLFRMIHDGAKRGNFRLPPRYGHLFDPDGWSFLEGRPYGRTRMTGETVPVPKVPDGVVLRVLEKLLLLDSERLSYRALDVEQIGSVYENMMGFRLERAVETSIGIGKDHVVVGLETLLGKKGAEREKYLKDSAGVELTGKAVEALKQASSIDDLIAAMSKRISPLTPRSVPAGGIYLQPTDERRRSGSHYTPRELTEPIVRTTLRPILADLGPTPTPKQILDLKVCDPAMGSGAFLVEACRQIAEELVKAYDVHGRPEVPPDEDILLYAQRQVAQHCLYGVDKNPFAVDLGKLAIWLATLARDHSFTFLDSTIRHGDTLVGLSREQIASFSWAPETQISVIRTFVEKAISEAVALRQRIQDLANSDDVDEKRRLFSDSDNSLAKVRLVGDCVVASFFSDEKPKGREVARKQWEAKVMSWLSGRESSREIEEFVRNLRSGERAVPCFHWVAEFPEVFSGGQGFDVLVGNPPFLGGKRISTLYGSSFSTWLTDLHVDSSGNADLAAHFFRRAFGLVHAKGTFGFVATNTISQGDTRAAGLRWLRRSGAVIYDAVKRVRWPGQASVVVSTVILSRGRGFARSTLNHRQVDRITAFLFHRGSDEDPVRLGGENERAYIGHFLRGMGFTFDDDNEKATPLSQLDVLRDQLTDIEQVVRPYLGGEEVLSHPAHSAHRYAICFADQTENEARRSWPELLDIVESRVKPFRMALGNSPVDRAHKERWWLFANDRPELRRVSAGLTRIAVIPRVSTHLCVAFIPVDCVPSDQLVVFGFDTWQVFSLLQSRGHEVWARFFSSTMGDGLRYAPSDCFETFPLPSDWQIDRSLEAAGRAYYEFRAALMVRNNEGLTKSYNRFHDPDESDSDIVHLRGLHAAMDRAVLDSYGWTDLQPSCEFLLDYEEADDDAEATGGRRKKKSWRYRWPDEFRDEVLARLLELNSLRAKAVSSPSDATSASLAAKPRGRSVKSAKALPRNQKPLFDEEDT